MAWGSRLSMSALMSPVTLAQAASCMALLRKSGYRHQEISERLEEEGRLELRGSMRVHLRAAPHVWWLALYSLRGPSSPTCPPHPVPIL